MPKIAQNNIINLTSPFFHTPTPTTTTTLPNIPDSSPALSTITVIIPARNEEATLPHIIKKTKQYQNYINKHKPHLPPIHDIIVINHDSTDNTATEAEKAGATVYHTNQLLPEYGPALGKGDVLWRSLITTQSDIIVWIDADLTTYNPEIIHTLAHPMQTNPNIMLVKPTYQRYYDGKLGEGGRTTQLTALPALKLLHPNIAEKITQPLAGEYAIRRTAALKLPFDIDYGVEIGLLIDIVNLYGITAVTETQLPPRSHRNRPLNELHEQATQVLRAILNRTLTPTPPQLLNNTLYENIASRPALNDLSTTTHNTETLTTT